MPLHAYAINRECSYSPCPSQTLILNPSNCPLPKSSHPRRTPTFLLSRKNTEISLTFLYRKRLTSYLHTAHTIIPFPSNSERRHPLTPSTLCHPQNSRSSVNISKTTSVRDSSVIPNPLVEPQSFSLKSQTARSASVLITGVQTRSPLRIVTLSHSLANCSTRSVVPSSSPSSMYSEMAIIDYG